MITSEDELVDDLEDNLNNFEDENHGDEAEEAPAETEEASAEAEREANKKNVKPKRVIRNPQPKLNEQTLKGPRGLTALPSYFDRVKYKGKGYEEQDLSVILKTYEYWCHRLFPKYPFDDCIAKIEKLGSKRAVVTHVKKIRLGMVDEDQPILNNDFIESDTEDNVNDQFDNLFESGDMPASVEVTEEQQERIKLNKERAEKLRKDKLNRAKELSQSLLDVAQSQNTENSAQNSCPSESGNMDVQNSPIQSSDDEDLDSIFEKIRQYSKKQDATAALNCDTLINDKQAENNEIHEPQSAEFLTGVSEMIMENSQTPDVIETHSNDSIPSESQIVPTSEITTTGNDVEHS